MTGWLLVTAALLLGQWTTPAQPPTMENVKALYAAAAYEEALSLLIALEQGERKEVELYRALCLLALNRTQAAERALTSIVAHDPFYRIDPAAISPRLVTLFADVRGRMLPAVAQDLFARAKTSFTGRYYETAETQFRDVLALVAEVNPSSVSREFSDLELLSDGFLSLIDAERSRGPAAIPDAELRDGSPTTVYTSNDVDVQAPVEIVKVIPSRVDAVRTGQLRIYQGLLEVLIDERGLVESAEIRRSITPSYDAALLDATREWRFHPAERNGIPVKYRRFFEVIARSQ
jgi:TonB family protein